MKGPIRLAFAAVLLSLAGCTGNSGTPGKTIDVFIPGQDIDVGIGKPDLPSGDPGQVADRGKDPGQSYDVAEGCPAVGALIITEIMSDPTSAADKTGEYFEIYNTTNKGIDIRDMTIRGNTPSEVHLITFGVPLIVPSHGYLVLGASRNKDLNGGIDVDYQYDKIGLSNTADRIAIYCGDTLIDQVKYNTLNKWPKQPGHAKVLDPSGYDAQKNDDPQYWCNASTKMPDGDYGSPGEANKACGAGSCGDGVKQAWEACDDGNKKSMDGCEPDCTLSPDQDGDGVPDGVDNCPKVANPDQADADHDGIGDACDSPDCGNGVKEGDEECDDGNRVKGDGCEPDCTISKDTDGDGIDDSVDNCPNIKNHDQADQDGDGIGDACDPPDCGNGFKEGTEECDDGNTNDGDGCSAACKTESFNAGDIVITEIMNHPANVSSTFGEYFELYNPTDHPINIRGWVLKDYSAAHGLHKLESDQPVVVAPKEYFVLARNTDPKMNGGFTPDYKYSGISLGSQQDGIGILWNNVLIDAVNYNMGHDGWPVDNPGHSLSLSPDHLNATDNDNGANWCYTMSTKMTEGDYGTPGAANDACAHVCGNNKKETGEECDDGNTNDGDGCSSDCRIESFTMGDVIITELMINPGAVSDTKGEYIELYNTTDTKININGWLVRIGNKSVAINKDGGLLIQPNGFLVLGNNGDYTSNGAVHVDYAYGSALSLVNGSTNTINLIWNGNSIDKVMLNLADYGNTNATTGTSLSLDPGAFSSTANDTASSWCLTPKTDTYKLAGGDWGTPGAANAPCEGPASDTAPENINAETD